MIAHPDARPRMAENDVSTLALDRFAFFWAQLAAPRARELERGVPGACLTTCVCVCEEKRAQF